MNKKFKKRASSVKKMFYDVESCKLKIAPIRDQNKLKGKHNTMRK